MSALGTELALEDSVREKASVLLLKLAVLMRPYPDLDVIQHLKVNNVRVLEHAELLDFAKELVTAQIQFFVLSMKLLTKMELTNVSAQPSVQAKDNALVVYVKVLVFAEQR
jgi:hypothetical protein